MNTKFDAGLTDPTKISVHQTAEPAQPVAWYVERRAPGYGDDGVKSGPWWSKNEAKRFADDHHVLRPLYAAPPAPAALAEFDASLTDPTKISVHQTAEPTQPVAWTTMPDADDWTFISGHEDPNGTLRGKWFPLYTSQQPPAAVPRLSDEDFLRCREVAYRVSSLGDPSWYWHYGRAVEAEVLRRCGVVE